MSPPHHRSRHGASPIRAGGSLQNGASKAFCQWEKATPANTGTDAERTEPVRQRRQPGRHRHLPSYPGNHHASPAGSASRKRKQRAPRRMRAAKTKPGRFAQVSAFISQETGQQRLQLSSAAAGAAQPSEEAALCRPAKARAAVVIAAPARMMERVFFIELVDLRVDPCTRQWVVARRQVANGATARNSEMWPRWWKSPVQIRELPSFAGFPLPF